MLQIIVHGDDSLGTNTWLNGFRNLPQDDREKKNLFKKKNFPEGGIIITARRRKKMRIEKEKEEENEAEGEDGLRGEWRGKIKKRKGNRKRRLDGAGG